MAFRTSVVTANDLVEGHSVFLAPEGWCPAIAQALIAFTPEEGAELEALAARFVAENRVVGPYLVEVALESGAPVPLLRRERIRAGGLPTVPVGDDAVRRPAPAAHAA